MTKNLTSNLMEREGVRIIITSHTCIITNKQKHEEGGGRERSEPLDQLSLKL